MTAETTEAATAAAAPPDHLSERAKTLWRDVVKAGMSIGRQTAIQTALEALDRADAARRQVDADGMLTGTEGRMKHAHPLLKVEKDCRTQFSSLWQSLGLHYNFRQDGRL